jgi:cell division protein FtsB
MNKFLVTAVIILSLMVIDQGHALHQLGDINQLQSQTINDYWNDLQADQQKYDADTAVLKQQIKSLNEHNKALKNELWSASRVIEGVSRCAFFKLPMSACDFQDSDINKYIKRYRKFTR